MWRELIQRIDIRWFDVYGIHYESLLFGVRRKVKFRNIDLGNVFVIWFENSRLTETEILLRYFLKSKNIP